VLVEKNELKAGATCYAAEHDMHYSNGAILTKLQKGTTDLFPQLERETGATGRLRQSCWQPYRPSCRSE
jgi:hypothetical protein